jgi:hypothetical protein
VKYTDPALSFEQQADQLLIRDFQADRTRLDRDVEPGQLLPPECLLAPFKRPNESFEPGTTLDKVWRRYTFDPPIAVVGDGCHQAGGSGRITNVMVEHHAREYGPFGYRDARNFRPEFAGLDHQRMVELHPQPLRPSFPALEPRIGHPTGRAQPENLPEWHVPMTPDNRRTFAVLTLLKWLLLRITGEDEDKPHLYFGDSSASIPVGNPAGHSVGN